MSRSVGLRHLVWADSQADRVVPSRGHTARLTSFTAAAMAFLAVFALALSLASDRLGDRWASALSRTMTVRLSAPPEQLAAQSQAVLQVLRTTEGVASARVLARDEQLKLLEPWFGPDLPLDDLPVPQLIEIMEESGGPDVNGLRLRLAGEAPGAVLDDHMRWRRPLVIAATRLQNLAVVSIVLIGLATAAMITLAAQSALAANAQVIGVLRLIGAKDTYIARAFVRRFTKRAFWGALIGTLLAMAGIYYLPDVAEEGAFLTGLGFQGTHWLIPLVIPFLAAIVAFFATRSAAMASLKGAA